MVELRLRYPRPWRALVLVGVLLLVAGCQTAPPRPAAPAPEASEATPPTTRTRLRRPARPVPAVPLEVAPAEADADTAAETVLASDVFEQLRLQLEDGDCSGGARADHWRRLYAGNGVRFAAELERALPLLTYVVERVQERNLPGEFALIPLVESWYRPDAVAPGGPAGMWQFMPATARGNGIHISEGYDGRFSPLDATDAAIAHLADLQARFGDWRLAAMAYNAGENRIARAIDSNGTEAVASGESRQPHGLALGTYEYLSKLKALSCLIAEPQRHRLELPADLEIDRLATVELGQQPGRLDSVANALGLDAATLQMLNAGYRNGRIPAQAPRRLLVPMSVAAQWEDGVVLADGGGTPPANDSSRAAPAAAVAHARRHTVQRGDTLTQIARRHGLALGRLMQINGLNRQSILRPGQVLKLEP